MHESTVTLLVVPQELAKLLGVSRQYVYMMVAAGRLPKPTYVCGSKRRAWTLEQAMAFREQFQATQAAHANVRVHKE